MFNCKTDLNKFDKIPVFVLTHFTYTHPIMSAILVVKIYSKELTPRMVEMVDVHFEEVHFALFNGVNKRGID